MCIRDRDNSVAVTVFKDNGEYRAKVLWFDDRLGSGVPMEKRRDTDNPVSYTHPDVYKRQR